MADGELVPVGVAWDTALRRYTDAGASSVALFNVDLLSSLRPRWERAVRPTPSMFRIVFTAANVSWYPLETAGDWVAVERLSDDAVELGLWRLAPRRGESRPAGPVLVTADRTRPENALPAVEALLSQVAGEIEN